jgi:hypothetical protein
MKAAAGNALGGVAKGYHNWRAQANAKKGAKAQAKADAYNTKAITHGDAGVAAGKNANLAGQKIQQSKRRLTSSESERRLFESIWRAQ